MCKVVFYWLIMNLIIQWQKAFQIVLGKFVYFLQTDISKWQWTVATFVKFLKSFLTSRHHYNVKYYVDRLSRGVGGLILCLNGINKCFFWSFACSDSRILIVRSDAYRVDWNRPVVTSGHMSNLAYLVTIYRIFSVIMSSRLGFKQGGDACCVTGCNHKRGNFVCSFLSFPKCPEWRRKWILAVNR
jgi:hypothetical protein